MQVAVEAIENIRTVQYLTREKKFFQDFCGHLKAPYDAALKEAQIQAIFYGFSIGIYYWMYAASFRYGAHLVSQHEMTALDVFRCWRVAFNKHCNAFYRVFFGVNYSTMMLGQATSFFPEYFKAKFAAGLIFKMLNIQPKIDSFGRHGLQPVCFAISYAHFTLTTSNAGDQWPRTL